MNGNKVLVIGVVLALLIAGAGLFLPKVTNGIDGIDGADGVDGLNGLDGTDGQDGLDGLDGMDGIDCNANPPPEIKIFYHGDNCVSHGEACDDGDYPICPPNCYTDWDIVVDVRDPENEKMGIDIYYKFNTGDEWTLLWHKVANNGFHKIGIDNSEIITYWMVEVSDGANLVWVYHTQPVSI